MSEPIIQPPQNVGQRIAKNMGMLFGGKAAAGVLSIFVLIISARSLSIDGLGSLLMLHAYVMLVTGIASFKSWQAIIQYGAEPYQVGDTDKLHRLMRFTIFLDGVAAIAATIVSMVIFPFVMPLMGLSSEYLIPGLIYCGLSAINLRSSPLGVLRLVDRFDLISLHSLIVPVVRLLGVLVCWYLEMGLIWFIGVWFVASAASYLLMPLLGLRELARRGLLKGLFSEGFTLKAPQPGVWRFVWISNLDATISLADTHIATLLSGGLLGPAFAAVFKIARDISDVLAKSARLLDKAMYPELVRIILAGEASRALRLIIRTSALMLGVGVMFAVVVYVFGTGVFTTALDTDYAGLAGVTTALIIAATIFAAAAPLYPALYALGEPGRATIARAGGVMAIIGLFFLLTPIMGEAGPGLAMIFGQLVGLFLVGWMCISRLGVRRKLQGG